MEPELRDSLRRIAGTSLLLVACDYDGTLAEIVPDLSRALPDPRAMTAFRAVATLHWTRTAIVSGRSLSDLQTFAGDRGPEILVGSHGAEWRLAGVMLTPEQRFRLGQIAAILGSIAEQAPGLACESKPAGVALHVRAAERPVAEAAIAAAVERCRHLPEVSVKHGSEVVEFMVLRADKGQAVHRARYATGATGVLFLGDDLTDEDVFRSLLESDLGVKVGHTETGARHRVGGVSGVASVLEEVASQRRAWLGTSVG